MLLHRRLRAGERGKKNGAALPRARVRAESSWECLWQNHIFLLDSGAVITGLWTASPE